MPSLTLIIDGMTCGGCTAAVSRILLSQAGVLQADVSLRPAQAIIEYDAEITEPALLIQAIEESGYDVKR